MVDTQRAVAVFAPAMRAFPLQCFGQRNAQVEHPLSPSLRIHV